MPSTLNDPDPAQTVASGLEAIIDATAGVMAAQPLDRTLARMAEALAGVVAFSSFAVYEVDAPSDQLIPVAAMGAATDAILAERPSLASSLPGQAVRERHVVAVSAEEDGVRPAVAEDPHVASDAMVAAPLMVGDRAIGTVCVWRDGAASNFSDAEQGVVRRAATLAALAYVNARQADVLREQARRDQLTGVFNRRHFELELGRLIARRDLGGAVVLFDIDEFKPINDRFGHPAGDRVLKALAAALGAAAGEHGTVYRIGGDEFAVLLPGIGRADAAAWTERAASAVADITPDMGYRVQTSAGVAQILEHDTVETVVRRADNFLLDDKRR